MGIKMKGKVLIVTGEYRELGVCFARKVENKAEEYRLLKKQYDDNLFNYCFSGWCDALNDYGYQAEYVVYNNVIMQRQWAKENGMNPDCSLEDIVISQINYYKPDILWFDGTDDVLFDYIMEKCPSIRVTLGWTGSAVDVAKRWGKIDIVFGCAPESIAILNKWGANGIHLNHGFNPKVLEKTKEFTGYKDACSFMGSIIRGSQYHNYREQFLKKLNEKIDLSIYSSLNVSTKQILKVFIKRQLYKMLQCIDITMSDDTVLGRINNLDGIPEYPADRELVKRVKAPVFGLDMFNKIIDSKFCLNIHADSSPEYASNMRLYEVTGVAGCLVTDMKSNLNELFDLDTEVVAYSSVEDCIEKLQWLDEHPAKIREIALAGQKRCLKDHTYNNRVGLWDECVQAALRRK